MIATPFRWLAHRLRRRTSDERQTHQDLALARRLRRLFDRDLALANLHGIHFYVQYGAVTLYGTIRHELDRDLLVSFVRQIPGVKGVTDSLQIVDDPYRGAQAELGS